MAKRFIASVLASILLVTGMVSGIASANNNNGTQPNSIWCGLWIGASLDVSNASDCITNDTSSTNPPNTNGQSTPSSTTGSYVALGDSVAAGLGLPLASNATSSDVQCGRSPLGYPASVARSLNLPLTNLACSGATAGDLVTQQHISGPNPAAQLNGAFASGTPQLMTITTGANDVHWQAFARACYVTNCTSGAYTTAANAYLKVLQLKLQYMFTSIESRSGGSPPQVIITGYYDPVSAACTATTQVTPAEIAWVQQQTNALNSTIQATAANYPFVTFVPLNFTGHSACSADPWVQDIQGTAPLHPTARGQQAIANAVIAAARY